MGRIAVAVFKKAQELPQPCSKRRQSGGSAPLHSQLTSKEQSSTLVKQAAHRETGLWNKSLSRMFQTKQICIFPYYKICLPGSKAVKWLHKLSQAVKMLSCTLDWCRNLIHLSHRSKGKQIHSYRANHSPLFPLIMDPGELAGAFTEIIWTRDGREKGAPCPFVPLDKALGPRPAWFLPYSARAGLTCKKQMIISCKSPFTLRPRSNSKETAWQLKDSESMLVKNIWSSCARLVKKSIY